MEETASTPILATCLLFQLPREGGPEKCGGGRRRVGRQAPTRSKRPPAPNQVRGRALLSAIPLLCPGFGAAKHLAEQGYNVRLLDASPSPGGLSTGWRTPQGRSVEAGFKGFWWQYAVSRGSGRRGLARAGRAGGAADAACLGGGGTAAPVQHPRGWRSGRARRPLARPEATAAEHLCDGARPGHRVALYSLPYVRRVCRGEGGGPRM
jgi:hypothetical protein